MNVEIYKSQNTKNTLGVNENIIRVNNLQCEDISFAYKKDLVLKNINFSLEKGDLIAILGPNGSGKSTLLKILDKILHPQTGDIQLHGENLKDLSIHEVSKKIGYIPQSEYSHFPASVFNTILMGRKPHFRYAPTHKDMDITSEIISQLGLSNMCNGNGMEMSGGQRQKVLFGRLLAQKTEILLLDEPTANLDLKHQLEILELLHKEANRNHKVVIIAIHDINMALKFCNKFILLSDGEVIDSGSKEIITEEMIAQIYGVEIKIIKNDEQMYIIPKCPIKNG